MKQRLSKNSSTGLLQASIQGSDKFLHTHKASKHTFIHSRLRTSSKQNPTQMSDVLTDCMKKIDIRQKGKHKNQQTQTLISSSMID